MDEETTIRKLKEELENKDIMINALLTEIKRLKNNKDEQHTKRIKIEDSSKEDSPTEFVTPKDKPIELNPLEGPPIKKGDLKEEVEGLIHHVKDKKPFSGFMFLDEFITFCADSIPFHCTATPYEPKGSLKTFVRQNYSRISSKISKEINKHSLLEIVSTLNCISNTIPYLEVCIIFHDILLMIEDYSKLHFIFHALFKTKIDEGLLGSTILAIVSHQQKVDFDLYRSDKNLLNHLTSLKHPFEIPKPSKTLEDTLLDFTVPISVFSDKTLDETIYQRLYSIRLLCHYLDWDYTYNTYFNDVLYPKIDDSEAFLLYLGLVNFNFYRLFGPIESVEIVFSLIKSKMVGVSPTSIVSYLLIKQIDPYQSNVWLSTNKQSLLDKGWSIEYLRTYLLF